MSSLEFRKRVSARLRFFVLGLLAILAACNPVNFYAALDQGPSGADGSGATTAQTIVLTIYPVLVTLSPKIMSSGVRNFVEAIPSS